MNGTEKKHRYYEDKDRRMKVDLTAMFGSGNEPQPEVFLRIFPSMDGYAYPVEKEDNSVLKGDKS